MGQEIIRRIYRPVVEQGIWRIRTNKELRELYKDLDIVADIKKKRFEWMGHVARMDQEGQLRKYLRVKRREAEEG
jgi:hypothetical protein